MPSASSYYSNNVGDITATIATLSDTVQTVVATAARIFTALDPTQSSNIEHRSGLHQVYFEKSSQPVEVEVVVVGLWLML